MRAPSLAGQNVLFRFRIGSDNFTGSLGWFVDNITFYTCVIPNPWTDDPLVANSTKVKKTHLDELHTRINNARAAVPAANGGPLPLVLWPPITASSTKILKSDIDLMRTSLNAVYTARGLSLPVYIDATLSQNGTRVRTVQIQQLRGAVVAVE